MDEKSSSGSIIKIKSIIAYSDFVDETLAVEEAVQQRNFKPVNLNIGSENFPRPQVVKRGEKELRVVELENPFYPQAVATYLYKKENQTPANLWDMSGPVTKEKSLRHKLTLVALGSLFKFHDLGNVAPFSSLSDAENCALSLLFPENQLNTGYRMLMVQN